MIERILNLLERLVAAHEKLAEANDMYVRAIPSAPPAETKAEEPKQRKSRSSKPQAEEQPVEAPKVEEATKEEPKVEEAPKEEPAKPKYKLEDVKAAVASFAGRRASAGSTDPKGEARALMAHFGNGKTKTDEIDPADYAAVIDAANADWLPEEEL